MSYASQLQLVSAQRLPDSWHSSAAHATVVIAAMPPGYAPGEADPTRTPLAEIPTPRRAHPRRRTAAERKADELEQIENRPSGLVNRTVRDARRLRVAVNLTAHSPGEF